MGDTDDSRGGGKWGGVCSFHANRRIPTTPGRGTLGFYRRGSHRVHQARRAVRCSASRMKGEPHPTKSHLLGGLPHLVRTLLCIWMTASNGGGYGERKKMRGGGKIILAGGEGACLKTMARVGGGWIEKTGDACAPHSVYLRRQNATPPPVSLAPWRICTWLLWKARKP